MKKVFTYVNFVLSSSKIGFVASSMLYVLNIVFAAGLYAVASFILSLAALHPSYDKMMIPVVCVRMFGVGRAVLSYSERYVSHENTFRILKKIRLHLYDKMQKVLPDYESRRADYLSQMILDVELLQEGILRLIYPFVSALFLWITGTILLLFIAPLISITYAIMFFLYVYLFPCLFFLIQAKQKEESSIQKEILYEDLLELKEGILEITSYGTKEVWKEKVCQQLKEVNGPLFRLQKQLAFGEAALIFLQGMSNLIFLYVAFLLYHQHKISGVHIAALMLLLTAFVTETMLPSQTYVKFHGLKRAIENVFGEEKKSLKQDDFEYKVNEVLSKSIQSDSKKAQNPSISLDEMKIQHQSVQLDNKEINRQEILSKKDDKLDKKHSLEIEHLKWEYKNGKELFSNLSFQVRSGEVVAFVGESGAGKSTLVHLILGFLQAKTGEIRYDGKNLLEVEEKERFKLFSVVDQKPFFFHQTIFENLKLANEEATEEEMMRILKKVHLDEYIDGLKDGIHTRIYEWAGNLSGGELQRLSVARALLKECPIYIFDEPTAGLDTMHEKYMMELILEVAQKHIVILITHRLVMMDKITNVVSLTD